MFYQQRRNVSYFVLPGATTGGVLWEKVFLEISQNSQENNCARFSFLIKLPARGLFKETFFTEHLFYRAPLGDCFCPFMLSLIILYVIFVLEMWTSGETRKFDSI